MATLSDLANGLIHWWSMDQSSGIRIDHIGGNHLSQNGTVQSGPGIRGNGAGGSAVFDGSTSNFLYAASDGTSSDSLSVAGKSFTIVCLIEFDDASTPFQYILGKNNPTTGFGEYTLSYLGGSDFQMSWNGDSSTITAPAAMINGSRVIVSIWKDASVYGGKVLDSTAFETGISDEIITNHDFRIGTDGNATGFIGSIDEVGFWNRKLSEEEIDLLSLAVDENNYPAFTDITGTPTTVEASDFSDSCGIAIDCCEEVISTYNSLEAANDTPDCPTDVEITFDPPPGARVNFPGYVHMETNSPTGTIRYAEFGMTPNAASTPYTEPIQITAIGGGISAKVFYDDCPPSRTFSIRYKTSNDEDLSFLFTYFCDTPDNVGTWGVWVGNGSVDNHWNLVLDAASAITIDRIDIFQLDTMGKWTTGLVWSTTEYVYPYPDNPAKSFRALPLLADDGAPINSDYDTPSPLVSFSGAKTIDLYGEMNYAVSGFFKVVIHMSTGKKLYSIITTDDCEPGAGPSAPCTTPEAPILTAGCSEMSVQFAMTVGHQYRIFVRSNCDSLGYVLKASGTVASNPQSVDIQGLTEGCIYNVYVSQWDNSADCDYVDSDVVSVTPLKSPSGTMSVSDELIIAEEDITVSWNVKNVTGVTITSDDGAFDIGATDAVGSQLFSPGPAADNCWHLEATNSCGTLNIDACTVIDDSVPASCPSGLASSYTVTEIDENGTYPTFGAPSFQAICGNVSSDWPVWNGTLPATSTPCVYRPTRVSIVINGAGRRVRLDATISLVASSYWELKLECNNGGADFWVGRKLSGMTPEGIYTRVSGDFAAPATLTVT